MILSVMVEKQDGGILQSLCQSVEQIPDPSETVAPGRMGESKIVRPPSHY